MDNIYSFIEGLSKVETIEALGAEALLALGLIARVAKDAEGCTEPLHSQLDLLERHCNSYALLAAGWAAKKQAA